MRLIYRVLAILEGNSDDFFFFISSLPLAVVCLLLPLLARSLKDPGETFKS